MKLTPTTYFHTIDRYLYYLYVDRATKALIRQYKLKFTYVSLLLFFHFKTKVQLTSGYPGCFRPYQFDYKVIYFTRIYIIGLKILCNRGFLKKVKEGTYQFTDLGKSLCRSYFRYMDHEAKFTPSQSVTISPH